MDDRAAVLETVNRYAVALDSRDWSLLDEVFAPDVVCHFDEHVVSGRAALRTLIRRRLEPCGPTRHLLTEHRVAVDGADGARCTCRVRASHAGAAPGEGVVYELEGEYRDVLVRTPAGWRITRREMKVHRETGSRDVLGS